jgi:hypothetical protein
MTPDNTTSDSALDDLTFLRSLVQGSDNFQRYFGQVYFAAGLCYSVQMLLHAGQALGWITSPTLGAVIAAGPTIVFLGLLAWLLRRQGGSPPTTANRAIGAVFRAVGLTNLALTAVIGGAAWRAHSLDVWLIYPCVAMVLQGLAWMVAWQVRRRSWFAAVAAGWFATGVGMGFAIGMPFAYVAIAGLGMLAFMLIPGAVMMRQARIG